MHRGIEAGITRDLGQRGGSVVVNNNSARGVALAELVIGIASMGSKVAIVQANVAVLRI